ncbi:MAG: hypothetical protein AB7S52_02550 [Sphaerochaetaceae bacterium]
MKHTMVESKQFDGDGLQLVYDQGEWVIGIKNYKKANDISTLRTLERHNETDESFVLLTGACTLLCYDDTLPLASAVELVAMQEHTVYTIPKGVWHTTIMVPEAKMILLERSGTSMENSELYDLSTSVIEKVQAEIR